MDGFLIKTMTECVLISTSPETTFQIGKMLGEALHAGDVVALRGDLGAGKTCCAQGIAVGLGVPDRRLVTSPTFTLIQEYQGRLPIYHFDAYRLTKEEDLDELGVEEYVHGEGITLIEWAERVPSCLPEAYVDVCLEIAPDFTRAIRLSAIGKRDDAARFMVRQMVSRAAEAGIRRD